MQKPTMQAAGRRQELPDRFTGRKQPRPGQLGYLAAAVALGRNETTHLVV